MKSPIFSIVVPIYNSANTLDKCIQSILSQSFGDFELLLVNDGSRDTSLEICKDYAALDKRIQVLDKNNGGVSSARNAGLDNAKGVWVTFCDSDDWVNDNWLSSFISESEGVDIVCQGMNCDHSHNASSKQANSILGVDFLGSVKNLLCYLHEDASVGYIVTKCFRNDLIQDNRLRFDERFNCYEDEEFVLRYLLHCNNALSRTSIGYNYICPDFEDKYVVKRNTLVLYSSMFKSAMAMYKRDMNDVMCHYLESYTMGLLEEFANSHKMEDLREYRRLVGPMILQTNLLKLTQWIIYWDKSSILAYVVLYVHSMLRRMFVR